MSREDWEACDAIRVRKRDEREKRYEDAKRFLPDLRRVAKNMGCTLSVSGERHWLVSRGGKAIVQYWPSAKKWQVVGKKKVCTGDVPDFLKFLISMDK